MLATQVCLLEKGDEGSWFSAMPGYSTESEGMDIKYGSVVRLASTKYVPRGRRGHRAAGMVALLGY